MTDQRFRDLPVCAATKRAIKEVFGYDLMTKVQAECVGPCLSGTDVVAKAKTGTGKTLGFLIPAVEALHRAGPLGGGIASLPKGKVGALIVSPTRELAQQTADEAVSLLKFHSGATVKCVVGGTNITKEQRQLAGGGVPHILVATPGRLNDHLENGTLGHACDQLAVLIFDEADQLLDMGFRPAIDKLLSLIPPKHTRRTFLFSATFPKEVDAVTRVVRQAVEVEEHVLLNPC